MIEILNRTVPLFDADFARSKDDLVSQIKGARVLIVGGGGSIGRATARQIFPFEPAELALVDISENNLVETVRDLRSSYENDVTTLTSLALDVGGKEFAAWGRQVAAFDYILNFSALKHVRSESNAFTISRMIDVNIFNAVDLAQLAQRWNAKKYFCVSTDKATNPENIMGASKRIMELFLFNESQEQNISFARFANVAFSDGSLLDGFRRRVEARQPLAAPFDVQRFFVTTEEAGRLCLFSCFLGENREIFFPKLTIEEHGTTFMDIAKKYLASLGYEAVSFPSAEDARQNVGIIDEKRWPCHFFESDTTGEKSAEEFYTENDNVDFSRFNDVGVIGNDLNLNDKDLSEFRFRIDAWRATESWKKTEIVEIFKRLVPNFSHEEKNKYLDDKM